MGAPPKLYLAGPEVFLPNALDIGRRKQELCAEYGFEGLFPFDNEVDPGAQGEAIDRLIYRANIAMLRAVDGGIFNLTPFRGPSADAGTIFELGFMMALGKPAFGYTNDRASYLERAKGSGAVFDAGKAQWSDTAGRRIENFEAIDNLMIAQALGDQGSDHLVRPAGGSPHLPLDDLAGFRACLDRARRFFGLVG